jgi:hypothetical protein
MTAVDTRSAKDVLFDADGRLRTYSILDGASVPGLPKKLNELRAESVCLFRGDVEPELLEVAPYLVHLEREGAVTSWLLREGWGKNWGVFALAQADLYVLASHFRRFLLVEDPEGKKLFFRFYDPRVLRSYLPTCNAEERDHVFGPVEKYVAANSAGEREAVFSRRGPG